MKPKKIWCNLGVSNLKRTADFYTALGFTPNPQVGISPDLVSFMVGNDGFFIHFFEKEKLEKNMNIRLIKPGEGIEAMFTLHADSHEEVNKWAREAKNAGAINFSEPAEFGEGYYGFVFSDPDGHTFNVFNM